VLVKINFLAIDFDQTIVDVHTHGQWKGSAHELSTHVRPLFQHLIPAAITADIKVAVVTFSPQCGQIKDVRASVIFNYSRRSVISSLTSQNIDVHGLVSPPSPL